MQDFIKNIDRKQFIRSVAIYFLVVGVLTLCGGAAAAGLGTFANVAGTVAGTQSTDPDVTAAAGALASASSLLTILGIVNLILGPVMIITAWGLFSRRAWARMGAVVVSAVSIGSSLLGLLTGAGILNLIWIVVGAFVLYMFFKDEGVKAEFPS